jgi:hypothetical protein
VANWPLHWAKRFERRVAPALVTIEEVRGRGFSLLAAID